MAGLSKTRRNILHTNAKSQSDPMFTDQSLTFLLLVDEIRTNSKGHQVAACAITAFVAAALCQAQPLSPAFGPSALELGSVKLLAKQRLKAMRPAAAQYCESQNVCEHPMVCLKLHMPHGSPPGWQTSDARRRPKYMQYNVNPSHFRNWRIYYLLCATRKDTYL